MTASLRPLAWSRIGFGAVVLIRTTPLARLADPRFALESQTLLGWPRLGELQTPAPGFGLSPDVVKLLCIARTLGAAAFLLGYRPRLTGIVAAVAGYLVVLQNAFAFTFTQHLLFVGMFVLAFTDCATLLALRPEEPRSPVTSRWLVWSLVTSVYAWAAISKLRWDWLDGRTLGLFFDEGKLGGPLAPLLAGTAERRALAGPLIVFIELALVPLLTWPRTRFVGFVTACSFHAVIEAVARPDVFGWGMVALLMSFVGLEGGGERRQLAQRAASNGQTKSP